MSLVKLICKSSYISNSLMLSSRAQTSILVSNNSSMGDAVVVASLWIFIYNFFITFN